MERIEVGQVWVSDGRKRTIVRIDPPLDKIQSDIHFVTNSRQSDQAWGPNFRKWITRTGAKLEGRDGE